jgi:hypothetical protein
MLTIRRFWAKRAREFITWKQPFTQALDESNAPFFKWFADGKLNVSYNCLDRQVEAGLGDKVAIIFRSRQRRSDQGHLQGNADQGVPSSPMPCVAWVSRRVIASSSTCR